MEEEVLNEIKSLYVDCPECEYMEDDQYQCGTCGCAGGNGRINVYRYIIEHAVISAEVVE